MRQRKYYPIVTDYLAAYSALVVAVVMVWWVRLRSLAVVCLLRQGAVVVSRFALEILKSPLPSKFNLCLMGCTFRTVDIHPLALPGVHDQRQPRTRVDR